MARVINFSDFKDGISTSLTIAPRKHSPWRCRHCDFEVFPQTREVLCKECGEVVDPFDVIMQYAENERRFVWNVEKCKAAIREFEKIQSEWSLTIREKRRIKKAMEMAKLPEEKL